MKIPLSILMVLAMCAALQAAPKPNIILIVTDDQGFADVGFRGSPIKTPNIDRLAQEGVILDRFYTCPVCSPTRAGLMTGRYPIRFGMQRAVNRPFSEIGLPDDLTTLPEALAKAGYEHRHILGKWHLGNMKKEHLPLAQGFTSQYGPYCSGIDYFEHTRFKVHDFHRNESTIHEKDYYTDLLSDETVRIIQAHNDDSPFFIYLPYGAPHTPLQAPKEEIAYYRNLGLPLQKAAYAAMVAVIDQGLGRIFAALEKKDCADNTLIVFFSDNGGSKTGNNSPLRGGKGSLYEGGIRVVAVARWPGKIPVGSTCKKRCSYIDILPTLLDAAGCPSIAESENLDGQSVLPFWQGNETPLEEKDFYSFYETRKMEALALIEGDWKLVRHGLPVLEGGGKKIKIELFNLSKDPSEKTNLTEAHPDLVSRLLKKLIAFRKLRSDAGVPPMVEPAPKGWKPFNNWEPKNEQYKIQGYSRPLQKKNQRILTAENLHDRLISKGFVLQEDDYHIWCNAPVYAPDGTVHLYVARWPIHRHFSPGWYRDCEIAHYKADKPEGPYTYVRTILKGNGKEGSWRRNAPHNVSIAPLPDGRYAMVFIANGNIHRKTVNGVKGFPASQKIGMMIANDLDGQWKLVGDDGLVLDIPTDPNVWSSNSVVGVNNPTLLPTPEGRFLLYYKAMKEGDIRRMGVAVADKVEGPYRFEKEPLSRNKGTIEDGFAFWLNNEICLLVTDCHGEGRGGGIIYRSKDGIHFDSEPVRAYEAIDHYMPRWQNPAPGWWPWVLQRPALLIDKEGAPTHLFAPCGTPPESKTGTSTFLFEIGLLKKKEVI